MSVDGVNGSLISTAVSGLRSTSIRIRVAANNIANSSTSRTASGEPYRRKVVVLSAEDGPGGGVKVERIVDDTSTEFKRVSLPGHPDAKNGYVLMPNVNVPSEMMELVTASRAYQANAAVLKQYKELVETALDLLK